MSPQINYPHIASMLFNTPLMCTTQLRDSVTQAVLPRLMGSGVNVQMPDDVDPSMLNAGANSRAEEKVEHNTHHNVCVIDVQGILNSRGSGMDAQCNQILSYESVYNLIDAAKHSPEVEEIVLDFNSGGGAAVGCFDMSEKLYELRSDMKITALINYNAYSAAYMMASACSEIVVSETSGVGSIGVIATHADLSAALDMAGLKMTTFYRGHRKNDLNPYEAVSKEAVATLDAELDDLYDLFVTKVARNRGLSVQSVIDTQAGTYRGQKAIDMGLADRLSYPQDAVNGIAQAISDRKLKERASPGGRQKIGARAAAMRMQAQL